MSDITKDILVNLLALDGLFKEYEFIHCYIGPKKYKDRAIKIKPKHALKNLQILSKDLEQIPNTYPFYRRSFIKDMLLSAISQAEFFCGNGNKSDFKTVVQQFIGAPIVEPFDLEKGLSDTSKYINNIGHRSIADFLKDRAKIQFDNINELRQYVYDYVDKTASKMDLMYSGSLPIPVKKLLSESTLYIEKANIPNLPCYYFYKGNNKGCAGITLKKEFTEVYLKGFILHEIMPGHHYYYLMKQHFLNEHSDADDIFYIDPYYSPENTINEGLAVNGDLILNNAIEPETLAWIKVEKLIHRILYNAWYSVNIEKKSSVKPFIDVLCNDAGFTKHNANEKIKYYTEHEKYYVASYPIGSQHIQDILMDIGVKSFHKLYYQHSLRTIYSMIKEDHKCQDQRTCL